MDPVAGNSLGIHGHATRRIVVFPALSDNHHWWANTAPSTKSVHAYIFFNILYPRGQQSTATAVHCVPAGREMLVNFFRFIRWLVTVCLSLCVPPC